MNRARSLALVCIATMLLPLVPLPAAEAATERVSFRPEIVFTDVKSETALYFQTIVAPNPNDPDRDILWTYPPARDEVQKSKPYAVVGGAPAGLPGQADFDMRDPLRGTVTVVGKNPFGVEFYVQGPPQLVYTVEIRDRANQDKVIATGRATSTANTLGGGGSAERIFVQPDLAPTTVNGVATYSYAFVSGASTTQTRIHVAIRAQAEVPGVGSGGTWSLVYGNSETPSRLTVVSPDAVKVAAWTEDENSLVTRTFRVDTGANARNEIRAFFMAKSAWGHQDFNGYPGTGFQDPPSQFRLERTFAPTAELIFNGQPWSFTEQLGASPEVQLVRDSGKSSPDEGTVLYTFRPTFDHIDYSNRSAKPAGTYELRFQSSFRPDDALNQAPSTLSTKTQFAIASAAVSLVPYPGVPAAETTSHTVAPGRTSTFVLQAKNDGDVYDNLTLELTPIPAQQPGWSATLGGPALKSGGRVELPPGAEGVVTVTIGSPSTASVGDSVTYQIRARSQIDPNEQTTPIPLLVTLVQPSQTSGAVGIIVPAGENRVRAGTTANAEVFLWNRGSNTSTLTATLSAPGAPGWTNERLVYGGVPCPNVEECKVVVEEVQPGQIVQVDVRATSERASNPEQTYRVRVSASYPGLENPPSAEVRFDQDLTAGFKVDILAGFGGSTVHMVEMQRDRRGDDPRQPSADKDALTRTWYRLWITNVGAADDTYRVKPASAEEESIDQNATSDPTGGQLQNSWGESGCIGARGTNCLPLVGYRNQDGVFSPITATDTVPVRAGKTTELYVLVPHVVDHDTAPLSQYDFGITVESLGGAGTTARGGRAVANNACTANQPEQIGTATGGQVRCSTWGYQALVGIESIERDPNYNTNHEVIIDNAGNRSITGRIAPGEAKIYKVRVTNAASFGTFTTASGQYFSSAVNLSLRHNKEDGWRAVMRFAGQGKEGAPDFGGFWNETLDLLNAPPLTANARDAKFRAFAPPHSSLTDTTGRQSFFDREIEILVQPPDASGRKVFAGENHDVFLQGILANPAGGAPATESLAIKTTVAQLPRIDISTPLMPRPQDRVVYAPVGKEAALGVFVINNGSSPTPVRFDVKQTSTGTAWSFSPAQRHFNLTPKENITVAVRVTAPSNVPTGSQATFEASVTYRERADDPRSEKTVPVTFTAEVIQTRAVTVTTSPPTINAVPGQTVNYTILVKNDGTTRATYKLDSILVPNWSASLAPTIIRDVAPNGGESRASFIMKVPGDVVSGTRYEFVARVVEVDPETLRPVETNNAAYAIATLNTAGGVPLPSLQVSRTDQIIERGGTVTYTFGVRNVGNLAGDFPIVVSGSGGLGWKARVTDEENRTITSVEVGPNARKEINLVIEAPLDVPERTVAQYELEIRTQDQTSGDRALVKATIHDYGLNVEAIPGRADMIPGLQATFNMRVTNLGNDNDTFNLTLDMGLLADLWSYEYGQTEVRVPPGEFRDVRLTVRSPKDNLPTPRTVQMQAYAGSTATRNISDVNPTVGQRFAKLDSTPLVLTVLDYRVGDVDGDGLLELAVDANKRKSDGFELFKEIYTTGTLSQAIESAQDVVTGHTRFLVDVPQGGSYDGVADVFWDPDASSVTRIQYTADVNADSSPDYFLDVNGDTLVDRVYDSGGRRYLTIDARDILGRGETRKQYLVYTDSDKFPDAFYDPEEKQVWKVIPAPSQGENVVGLIPKDKTKPTLYYDIAAQRVYPAGALDTVEFFKEYWYVGALAVLALIVLTVAVVRRKPVKR